jgi:hypothetical protein
MAEAIELVASKRGADGLWVLETRYPGVMPVEIDEGEGLSSRWNTLRALRVLTYFARNSSISFKSPSNASRSCGRRV